MSSLVAIDQYCMQDTGPMGSPSAPNLKSQPNAFRVRSSGGLRKGKNKRVDEVYQEYLNKRDKSSNAGYLPKIYEASTGVNSKTTAERQLNTIVKLCIDTLEFNSGKNIEDIDFDLFSLDQEEAEVFSNAKYARSTRWKSRFGPEMAPSNTSDGKNWLRNFFKTPYKKRKAAEDSVIKQKKSLKPIGNRALGSASQSMIKRSALQSASVRAHPVIEEMDDRNEKMVEIIKMINRQLADFIEREGRMLMARKTQTKSVEDKTEKRAQVCEKEIKNNEAIIATLMRDLEFLKHKSDRASTEG